MSVFEDLNNLFRSSRSALAEAVIFKLNPTSTSKTIYVNFFYESSESQSGEVAVTRAVPMCMANTDDVIGANHQSTIIRNGDTFYVIKPDHDDDGETVLYLSKNQII